MAEQQRVVRSGRRSPIGAVAGIAAVLVAGLVVVLTAASPVDAPATRVAAGPGTPPTLGSATIPAGSPGVGSVADRPAGDGSATAAPPAGYGRTGDGHTSDDRPADDRAGDGRTGDDTAAAVTGPGTATTIGGSGGEPSEPVTTVEPSGTGTRPAATAPPATTAPPAGGAPARATGSQPSAGRFETLPPGTPLPDGAACATRVRPRPETVPENGPYNQRRGRSVIGLTYLGRNQAIAANDFEARIDGDFTGTTDEIIQWGACKWGFDEDVVRAQAYAESTWFAGQLGDCGRRAQTRTGGDGGCTSVGLLQVNAAGLPAPVHEGLFPVAWESTAMNVDYALAVKRLCYEGLESWLADQAVGTPYRAGDEWGCVGRWFSGGWHDDGAAGYIARVRQLLDERPWEGRFVGCPAWERNFYCSDGSSRGF